MNVQLGQENDEAGIYRSLELTRKKPGAAQLAVMPS
jgi:hypothetical protein